MENTADLPRAVGKVARGHIDTRHTDALKNTRTKWKTHSDPELSFKTKLAALPLVIQGMISSNKIDDNGVLIHTASNKPGYFAVGFMSEKSNGTYRYVWLYRVRAKPVTEIAEPHGRKRMC